MLVCLAVDDTTVDTYNYTEQELSAKSATMIFTNAVPIRITYNLLAFSG